MFCRLVKETPFSVLWDYSTAFLMFGTSMVCVAWLVSPSRFVTRLTQVRRQAIASSTPASTSISGPLISAGKKSAGSIGKPTGNEGEREFIRFQHGGHLMCWGELENGREVNQDEMKINLIAGQGELTTGVVRKMGVTADGTSTIALSLIENENG